MDATENRAAARVHVRELTRRGNELIDRIERDTELDRRTWKPSPGAWSLTEVVEHLSLVANGMLRVARPPALAPSVVHRMKLAALTAVLRSPVRFPTPVRAVVPRDGTTWNDASSHLIASNLRWSEFVESETFDTVGFTHPLVGRIASHATASFLLEHFDHHLRQVDRIFAAAKRSAWAPSR
ncbi:MAG: DinB family protein [Gemmatimonadota bacterium]|nr:DinB family protein [Gemmatimonadota bacterium]